MRSPFVRSIIVLAAVLGVSGVAMAQGPAPGSKASMYDGNRLKPEWPTGGPAPVRDLSGHWAGNLTPRRGEVPPLTPLGQELDALILSEPDVGTGFSNDPMNTCDPFGIPRSLVFETRGVSFATMPNQIAILQQYQRVWRYVWMDGRPLPTEFDTADGVPSRYYGYSSGRWEGDHTLVIDTVGLSPNTWLDKAGNPHSVNMHVEERYERIDHNHMMMTVTVTDPEIFGRDPWVLSRNEYRWIPDQESEEQLCVPSEMIRYMELIANPSFHPAEQ
jgi:hypothetical protein